VSAIGSRPGRVAVYGAVVAAADEVTVEEFRLADLRCEQDARQGRRLLYLVSNTEWVRRTTEHVEIGRARVVDTEVVVDVDLSYLPHALLDDDVVWLPVLAVPPPVPEAGGSTERDPVTSMEVTDAAGARVSKAPQSQVHRRLAAALAELVLGRLPRGRPDGGSGPTRDEQVLLSAALRRLLPGPADDDGAPADDDDAPAMLDRGRAQVEERLIVARLGLLHAVRLDLARPRPVLRSRLVEMVAALVGVLGDDRLPARPVDQDIGRRGDCRGCGCARPTWPSATAPCSAAGWSSASSRPGRMIRPTDPPPETSTR